MRLKSIKLSGFKSFVDPTSIPIAGSLIGIVGPNGCGKSNIIDAVRWVMGESSARNLRGDSMADVVFNGSNARKPVSRASVELIFDNSDGSAGGQYAAYSEISIRREAGRDGHSDYFLNKTRCRRKDITDLFLGTGLGPRAYSIIEQGMVTRIIEAKPEDLRGFIEEAAGISRYKERRRETENRIRHTRENLDRVEDIRGELATQIARLEKQSKAAAKYKELKAAERLVRAQLGALHFREFDAGVKQQEAALTQHQIALDAALAQQRGIEAEIERLRARQTEATEHHNDVHSEFFAVGAEISRLEQAIEHARETRANQLREQEQVNRAWDEASAHRQDDARRLEEVGAVLSSLSPRIDERNQALHAAAAQLTQAEGAMAQWQAAWEAFVTETAEQAKQRELQSARIQSLEEHIADLQGREARLREELAAIEPELDAEPTDNLRREAAELDQACEQQERALNELEASIRDARAQRERVTVELDRLRQQLHNAEARLASLRELQSAATAEQDAALAEWLRGRALDQAPRLASRLSVESGWERALERVLGADLVALCTSELDVLAVDAAGLKPSRFSLLDSTIGPGATAAHGEPLLLDKVSSDVDLAPLLAGIQTAENLPEALARRSRLAPDESIVTRDGGWVGRNWVSLANETGAASGWLKREREIEELVAQCARGREEVARLQAQADALQQQLHELEAGRETQLRELNERHRARTAVREQLGHKEARVSQLSARAQQIRGDHAEVSAQLERERAADAEARRLLAESEAAGTGHATRRAELTAERERLQAALEQARAAEAEARDGLHRLEIERQGQQTTFDSTRASIARLEGQLNQLSERRDQLVQLLAADATPETELRRQLDEFLAKRIEVEGRLTEARKAVSDLDAELREQEQARHAQERQVQEIREQLEGERVKRQELLVRRDTIAEQVRDGGFELAQVLAELPSEATEEGWQQRLESLGNRIERLGPINLVAIEEYQEQSQRKEYLDKQFEDLSQALATLEEAIRKIDRETRTRFRETFDKVNDNVQGFFPKLFGGGSAYLELTDNDLLETGVTVMARPPGKRNSTIHLLSGGEKALTAVALLFAIFELNPAPFCLLDEVDAPLDDANVERYSETIKTLSERTQLVYITHNKISMEIANVLIGVTMSEPGVSRLVAVDVEEALQMVAQ